MQTIAIRAIYWRMPKSESKTIQMTLGSQPRNTCFIPISCPISQALDHSSLWICWSSHLSFTYHHQVVAEKAFSALAMKRRYFLAILWPICISYKDLIYDKSSCMHIQSHNLVYLNTTTYMTAYKVRLKPYSNDLTSFLYHWGDNAVTFCSFSSKLSRCVFMIFNSMAPRVQYKM